MHSFFCYNLYPVFSTECLLLGFPTPCIVASVNSWHDFAEAVFSAPLHRASNLYIEMQDNVYKWNADGQAVRQHSAALLIVRAKERERGQTLPTGGLFYGPSNRQVGMGKSGGENGQG